MVASVSPVVASLSTGNQIALGVVGGIFILFALVSSFVLPARYPNFPGRHVGWYVAAGILFFLAMISAVIVFGVEEPEAEHAAPEATTAAMTTTAPSETTTAMTTTAPSESTTSTATVPAAEGDPAAGKAVFGSAGCGGCHTMKAAGASGSIGPNLDDLKPSYDTVVHQVEVGGGAMPAFKGQLSDKQIQDVSAYVVASTQ
jgi:mono/diheme cytochrome c family protein